MSFDLGKINPECPGCRELERRVGELEQQLAELRQRLEALTREAHRQAAPFRRPENQRKEDPGKPGRKKGHHGAYRQPPPAVEEEVTVPLDRCPECGGPVERVQPVAQILEELEFRVQRLRLTTHVGQCPRCGPVRSTHPRQVSTATGAAGTHLGARALGFAAYLNKQLGVTMRKTCDVLAEFGLRLTPGGLSHALARLAAGRLQSPFVELVQAVRHSPAVHADETGWWLEGHGAFVWVFATPRQTLFTIDNRSQEVVRRLLGDDYPGVLISDCLASYDPHPGRKSKCFAHHLKAIREAQAEVPASRFLANMYLFCHAVLVVHRLRADWDPRVYQERVGHLEHWLDTLLATPGGHPAELRIANRFRKHRPHLLTCLHVPGVDPTNNLAERQLRPIVIVRKLSAGNKTAAGKQTLEVLASLAATCRQQGRSFSQFVAAWRLLHGPSPPYLDPT